MAPSEAREIADAIIDKRERSRQSMTDDQRELLVMILEDVAKSGLPGPRDLDVAIEAIGCAFAPPPVAFAPTGEPNEEIPAEDLPKPPVRTRILVDADIFGKATVFRANIARQDRVHIEQYGFSLADKGHDETDPVDTVAYFRWFADRIESHLCPAQLLAAGDLYQRLRKRWEDR